MAKGIKHTADYCLLNKKTSGAELALMFEKLGSSTYTNPKSANRLTKFSEIYPVKIKVQKPYTSEKN